MGRKTEAVSPPCAMGEPAAISALVYELVRQSQRGHRLTPAHLADRPGVMLDIEVDGYRCLLLRLQPDIGSEDRIALSPREQEIARMVAKGHPNKTIARVLDISTWTVGTHLRRIFAKLGVGSRAAMVARLMDSPPARDSGHASPDVPRSGVDRMMRSSPAPLAADGWGVLAAR